MGRSTSKPQTVTAAKQRLLEISTQQQGYLNSIKKHPAASVGGALAAGLLIHQVVKKGGLSPSLINLGLILLKKL